MQKSLFNVLALTTGAYLLVLPAIGAPNPEPNSEGNIFTPPSSAGQQSPGFSQGGPEGKMRRGSGEHKDGIPDFRQVKNLQSLTPQQRVQIKQIMEQSKAQMGPIKEQMEALRDKNQGGDPGKSMADSDSREKFVDLRRQMKDARKQSWEQMKKVLTEQQLQEMEAMRHGEMQPATFNQSKAGNGGENAPAQNYPSNVPPVVR